MNTTLKRAVITAGLEAISVTGAGRFLPAAAGRGLVFTLHHVRPATARSYEPNALLSVTPEFLDVAISEALSRGYRPAALADLPALLENGASAERYVAFTLDDGCRDNAVHAAPVFRRHGVPYTLFVTKGLVERTHTMWWETAEALTREAAQFDFDFGGGTEHVTCATVAQKTAAFLRLAAFIETLDEDAAVARLNATALVHGVDPVAIVDREIMTADEIADLARDPLASFGAHTVSHCNLARLNPDRLDSEIARSAEALGDWTGKAPVSIAYPYGWKRACGPREREAARNAGLAIGVTTQPGVLKGAGQDDWLLLSRVSLNGLYQKRRYVAALLSGIPFRLM